MTHSGTADMVAYLYPNTSSDDGAASDASNALAEAWNEILVNTPSDLDEWSIHTRTDHPNLDDSSVSTFYDKFSNWREGPWWNPRYTETGVHIGISTNLSGGRADGGNSSNPEDDAFVSPKDAVAGSDQSVARFKNVVIQEALHTFIDKDLSGVQNDITDSEHDLGMVFSNGNLSPMATGYLNSAARTGPGCKSNHTKTGYTTTPTSCTNDAVYETFQDGQ